MLFAYFVCLSFDKLGFSHLQTVASFRKQIFIIYYTYYCTWAKRALQFLFRCDKKTLRQNVKLQICILKISIKLRALACVLPLRQVVARCAQSNQKFYVTHLQCHILPQRQRICSALLALCVHSRLTLQPHSHIALEKIFYCKNP